MKLPSKVTSYKESVISKFPIVLESLSYSNETPRQLYEKEKQKFNDINEYMEVLDALFLLGKVGYDDVLGELYYVKWNLLWQILSKTIRFREGLNVVLGTPDADNSIGKSTLLLIVDYAFGGDTYARASDIVKNIGEHKIGFKFQFEDGEYAFWERFLTVLKSGDAILTMGR